MHPYPYDDNLGTAKKVLDIFFASPTPYDVSRAMPSDVRYAIALAADPRHTNLSLMFDRQMAMVMKAAQEEGYDYNSSWMPWQVQAASSLNTLGDQQYAAELTTERETCPGLLLFRRRPDQNKPTAEASYQDALLVFVVGEEATGGINQEQWDFTTAWLTDHAQPPARSVPVDDGVLRILGPTFTGSLVSLERNLSALYQVTAVKNLRFRNSFPYARIFSGSVTDCSAIHWFVGNIPDQSHIHFGTFQENDFVHISRFLDYLENQGTLREDVAIVSEDETTYGSPAAVGNTGCDLADAKPARLSYPRDISALREAYQKESVFESTDLRSRTHPVLRETGGGVESSLDVTDTVTSFGGSMTAIDEEAYLYGLVGFLRTHHTRVLLLRCTNPLDFIFLARFFYRAYPEARVVTVGSDLLFPREIDTTEFRGLMSLSSYPLIPPDSHWTAIERQGVGNHNHLIAQGHIAEGMYLASRYLLQNKMVCPTIEAGDCKQPTIPLILAMQRSPTALSLERVIRTEDYAQPFWFADSPERLSARDHPATWLAAVGRDGYWPVAILDGPEDAQELNPENKSTIVNLRSDGGAYDYAKRSMHPPLAWLVCTLLALGLIIYQFRGVGWSKGPSDGFLSAFGRSHNKGQNRLLGMSCALCMMLLFEMTAVCLIPKAISAISSDPTTQIYFAIAIFILGFMTIVVVFRLGEGGWKRGALAAVWCYGCLVVGLFLYFYALCRYVNTSNDVALFYRTVHLSNGVSPLVPILLITLGLYLWNWQAMAGHHLLIDGSPMLPPQTPGQPEFCLSYSFGKKIVKIANPLEFLSMTITLIPAFLATSALLCFFNNLPLMSLEGKAFDRTVNGLLLFALTLTVAEAVRLYSTWVRLKKLLVALTRLPLRRTFANLRSLEGGSIWGVSGNVRRVQFDLFVDQMDAARHLITLLEPYTLPVLHQVAEGGKEIRQLGHGEGASISLAQITMRRWGMRVLLSAAVAELFEELSKSWKTETASLNLLSSSGQHGDEDTPQPRLPLSERVEVQRAEEFVAYQYIAFIQNISARMRTMALSMICLFIAACFAVSFYPFVPRTEIVLWLILNLALIGSVVVYVYAGMERDEILSYMTNSKPGRLGSEFWLKSAAFFVGPVIGILTTQFPSIADNVVKWLQPGLDAMSSH